jgi:hypothetical protein
LFNPDRTGIRGSNSISILGKPSFRDVMLSFACSPQY